MILESVALFLLVTGLRAALAPRPKAPTPDDPKPPRADEGAPVPVVFGSAMIAPNTTAFRPVRELDEHSSYFIYYPIAQLTLCHGPVDEIADMRFDDGQTQFSLSVNGTAFPMVPESGEFSRFVDVKADPVFGGEKQGGFVGGHAYFFFGKTGQPVATKYAEKFGADMAPTHDGIAYVFVDQMEWGESAQMRAVRFLVRRYPWALYDAKVAAGGNPLILTTAQIRDDANPAAIVYEILTNTRWGLGLPAAVIDLATFLTAAARLADEGCGLSVALERQSDAESVIEDVCRHAYATLQQDPVTGLIRFDVHRDDDASEATIDTDSATFHSVTRPSEHELPNFLWVRYTEPLSDADDRDNTMPATLPVINEAAIQATGETRVETYDYLMAAREYVAQLIGSRLLPRASLPLARVRFTTDRRAAGWKIGTVVTATDADRGLSSTRLRVTRIDWGTLESGQIECDALEEPIPGAAVVTVPDDEDGGSGECPVVLQDSADGGLQWVESEWTFDIRKTVTSGAPNGLQWGGTDLPPDGFLHGGYALFACGTVDVLVTRTLTGLAPFQYVTLSATASQWSSTSPIAVQTGDPYDSGTPGWRVVSVDLLAPNPTNTLGFRGWANAAGNLVLTFTYLWIGCNENRDFTLNVDTVKDYSGGCDPDELEPGPWGAPRIVDAEDDPDTAVTFVVTGTVSDADEAVAAGAAIVRLSTWDGAAWVTYAEYSAGVADGTITVTGTTELAVEVTVAVASDPVKWRLEVWWYDPDANAYVLASGWTGKFTPAGTSTGGTVAALIFNNGNYVGNTAGNILHVVR